MNQYSAWLQKTTAGMLATAPKGPGIIPAQYRAMADYRTEYRTATPPEAPVPAPARETTSLAEVRRMVQAKKAEMAAEREGRDVRKRIRTEIARDFRYAIAHPPPQPYDLALAERGTVPEVWQSDGGCPEPYTLALGEIVPRRADGTPVTLPEGDDPPQPYTLALEARRSPDPKDIGN